MTEIEQVCNDAHALITLVIEHREEPEEHPDVIDMVQSMERKDLVIQYLAGWVSGDYDTLEDWQEAMLALQLAS